MLTGLRFENFRCFQRFAMDGLTRVTLLVGKNNSGKTSVLEGVEILLSEHPDVALCRACNRRDEITPATLQRERTIDVAHLFLGHEITRGGYFEIADESHTSFVQCTVSLGGVRPPDPSDPPAPSSPERRFPNYFMVKASQAPHNFVIGLTSGLGVTGANLDEILYREDPNKLRVRFLGTDSINFALLSVLWGEVILAATERDVFDALRLIDPNVEQITFLPGSTGRGSIVVSIKDSKKRVPLGSMGDGMQRLLNLSINLVRAEAGTLLIDEIDTGLHHSVMEKMWKLVIHTAKRLDMQVIATTHSEDCIRALARVCDSEPELKPEVSLHRIDKQYETSMPYSADNIMVAVEQDIEVR